MIRRILKTISFALLCCAGASAQKLSALPVATPATTDDVAYLADPAGTPSTKRASFVDIFGLLTPSMIGSSSAHGNGAKFQFFTGSSSTNDCAKFDAGGNLATAGSPCGTVTGVGLSVPGVLFSVSGSPVTTSGTFTFSLLTQGANKVFAGPSSGADATPAFRPLVAADLPTFTDLTVDTNTLNVSSVNHWVGVGTTAPAGLFHVRAAANDTLLVRGHQNLADGASVFAVNDANSAFKGLEFGASSYRFSVGTLQLAAYGAGYLTTDSSGNVAAAATPVTSITGTANQVTASAPTGGVTLSLPQNIHTSATPQFGSMNLSGQSNPGWSGFTYLMIGGNGGISGDTFRGAGTGLIFNQNAYYDGTNWRYVSTDYASRFYLNAGGTIFDRAASGTAGNTLSWTTVFKLDQNATSGETPLLLLDISAGTLKRVSIGAADSCGTGYKCLRVPN